MNFLEEREKIMEQFSKRFLVRLHLMKGLSFVFVIISNENKKFTGRSYSTRERIKGFPFSTKHFLGESINDFF